MLVVLVPGFKFGFCGQDWGGSVAEVSWGISQMANSFLDGLKLVS